MNAVLPHGVMMVPDMMTASKPGSTKAPSVNLHKVEPGDALTAAQTLLASLNRQLSDARVAHESLQMQRAEKVQAEREAAVEQARGGPPAARDLKRAIDTLDTSIRDTAERISILIDAHRRQAKVTEEASRAVVAAHRAAAHVTAQGLLETHLRLLDELEGVSGELLRLQSATPGGVVSPVIFGLAQLAQLPRWRTAILAAMAPSPVTR